MTRGRARTPFGERVYRALLLCYPAEFRYEYGPAMTQLFRDRRRDEGALLWLHLVADIALTAPKEHAHMLWHDLRYAVRTLRQTPLFTTAAILTLALGIGANTAIFSVVNAVLLRPLPYAAPDRLVRLWETNQPLHIPYFDASIPNFLSWQEQARSFEQLAAWRMASVNLVMPGDHPGEPQRVLLAEITANLLPMLGLHPFRGRGFLPRENTPGQPRVVMISHGLWERRFGADPSLIGKPLTLDGIPCTVAAIAPPEFRLTGTAEAWMPLPLDPARENRGNKVTSVVGKLKPGVTLAQAQTEMDLIARRLEQQFPASNKDWRVRMASFYHWIVPRDLRTALLVLLGAVAIVLLIACANVANLLLARASVREKEISIRTALGVSRIRLTRQFLTESLFLALLGGTAGVLAAVWGVHALRAAIPAGVPHADRITVDSMVLAFSLALSLATGLLFGLAPCWHATRIHLNAGRAPAAAGLLRGGLVIAEVALATLLLVGAGLLIQSFLYLQRAPLGFNPGHLLTAQISLPESRYPEEQKLWAFYRQLLDALAAAPGVRSAALSSGVPFGAGDYTGMPAIPVGPSALPAGNKIMANWRIASTDYFRAMEIPLLRGRFFETRDTAARAAPVMIINEDMARRLWPNEDATGKQLRGEFGGQWTVVGVVGNVRLDSLAEDSGPTMYWAAPQWLWPTMTLVLRTDGDPAGAAAILRRKVRELDAQQPVFNVKTMDQWLDRSAAQPRLNTLLLGLFAGIALLLSAVGIYGVLAYAVSRRTREIGIRMALGARGRNVVWLVAGRGMTLGAIGIAAGLAGAWAFSRALASLLYGVRPRDPATFAAVTLALAAVALLACYLPARRASRVDPARALRCE